MNRINNQFLYHDDQVAWTLCRCLFHERKSTRWVAWQKSCQFERQKCCPLLDPLYQNASEKFSSHSVVRGKHQNQASCHNRQQKSANIPASPGVMPGRPCHDLKFDSNSEVYMKAYPDNNHHAECNQNHIGRSNHHASLNRIYWHMKSTSNSS